jgi:hypothetical protein
MEVHIRRRDVTVALQRVFEELCDGSQDAVRVVCVPNGIEFRFLVQIEPDWQTRVYTYLAKHTAIELLPDASPLNLSQEQALRLTGLGADRRNPARDSEEPPAVERRAFRRMPMDITGDGLRHTFQP